MRPFLLFTAVILAVLSIGSSQAQTQPGLTQLVVAANPTAESLTVAFPPSHVRVPPTEAVILLASVASGSSLQWTKNGKIISGATGTSYWIPLATTGDSGVYNWASPSGSIGASLYLDVVPAGNIANFSTLVSVPAGGASSTIGFVATGSTSTTFLIRAVGPSLKAFGIANPVAKPQIHYYDSTGKEFGFVYADGYNWQATFAGAGAFPLSASGDAYDLGGFRPGSYTVAVTDGAKLGGTVLLEFYQGVTAVALNPIIPITTVPITVTPTPP